MQLGLYLNFTSIKCTCLVNEVFLTINELSMPSINHQNNFNFKQPMLTSFGALSDVIRALTLSS